MPTAAHLKKLQFRAWHRGTREADYLIGGFFDRYSGTWGAAECAWFERLLDAEDHDVLAWALGTAPVPEEFAGEQMNRLRRLDYVDIPR